MSNDVIAVDYARIHEKPNARSRVIATRLWGERVRVLERGSHHLKVEVVINRNGSGESTEPHLAEGYILSRDGVKVDDLTIPEKDSRVLAVSFADVQQGDASVIVTPSGKVMLIDGGDNKLFARYLAARFPGTTAESPQEIDALVVTHGDADHFAGLSVIADTETDPALDAQPWKRAFIRPKRVFHNGIVKRPSTQNGKKVPDRELLGPTIEHGGRTYLHGLVNDLLKMDTDEMNEPFRKWRSALEHWHARAPLEIRRIAMGDGKVFDEIFSDDGLRIEVLGPLVERIEGRASLPFLGEPPKGPRTRQNDDDDAFTGLSASHTINGHSVVLRIRYGGYHFLLAGDLNEQAEMNLTRAHNRGELDLTADVLKVPHHGSADFSAAFFRAVSPLVSVVSSGDESERKEYIHPRASLMGALGRFSRVEEPIILVTELVAFFRTMGYVYPAKEEDLPENPKDDRYKGTEPFYAFQRSAFGLVELRTDGERLVVVTHSGKEDLKEAYAFQADRHGIPAQVAVRKA